MVRREIKNFELIYGGESYPCSVPFSVKSVLSAEGVDTEGLDGQISFESDIYVDDAALAMRNFYLRVRGLDRAAKIYIGDKLLGETDGVTPVYNFDASDLLSKGNNRLSIRLDSDTENLLYAGMSETVEILRFSSAIIDTASLSQQHEEGSVKLSINLGLIGDPTSVRAVATLTSPSGQLYYAGLTKGQGSITVANPLYWWPKGQGVQNLYRLTISLYGDRDIEDSVDIRLGLRTAEKGDGGSLLINGCRVLPMGAVYIPDGDPDLKITNEKEAAIVTAASMAGYNCLLIPLGAPHPTGKFYEMCDVHGIMVIEEHSTLDTSAVESIKHRSNHPSLCLIDLIGEGDRSDDTYRLSSVLPDMSIRELREQPTYVGMPSLPSMKTLRAAIPEEERGLFSYSIEAISDEGAIRVMLLSVAERYPYPADLSAFAYASALASAHKVGEVIKDARLSLGGSGRGIFYRIADREMTVSPSAIDCRGRWKPLQYYSARHFAPITVYADYKDGKLTFSASSQRKIDCIGTLEYRIANASNITVYKGTVDCEIGSMTSSVIHTDDIAKYVSGNERDYYIEYFIKEGSFTLGRGTMLFVPEKHFRFKKPKIKSVITGADRRFSITLSSDVFVKDMELDFDGVDVVFEDNYFDLTSDAPVKINFTVTGGIETSYHLKDLLQMRSVYDLT
ncbi:MAG: hypothetical protein IJX58_08475 [Clostridia bacterium]|nr:hypothetical protein [Clostridia bacterium]MBQ8415264.1 hypothetical protein [Clostridia bacterium]